ncbi:TPA: hypothetical protein ACU0X8_002346 [Legionella anisa]
MMRMVDIVEKVLEEAKQIKNNEIESIKIEFNMFRSGSDLFVEDLEDHPIEITLNIKPK